MIMEKKNVPLAGGTNHLNQQPNYNEISSDNQEKLILDAPGLVGKIAKYVNEVSYKEQPMLALAASVVFTGTLYGHVLRTVTDLRTNLYMFALAETGAGKEGSRQAIKKLIYKLPPEFHKFYCGDPVSPSGLLSALNKADGTGIFLIDEIGHYISGINGQKAPSHAVGIMGLCTRLYTSANTMFLGSEYSDKIKGRESRVDIDQPCACILGSGTPERVYGSITQDDIVDGFLPRWLLIESNIIAPKDNPQLKSFEESSGLELVKNIVNHIKYMKNQAKLQVEPLLTVKYEPEALQLRNEYKEKIEALRIKAIESGSCTKSLYTRANEHVEKLALIACEFVDGRFVITEASVRWAISLVEYSISKMRRLVENVASSPHEQSLNCMLDIIKRHNGMSKSEFGNYCRRWTLKVREELLSELIDFGHVVYKEKDGTKYVYYNPNV